MFFPCFIWLARNGLHLATIILLTINPADAQSLPHDDNLPHAKPQALQRLSDDRLRQRLLQDSQAPFHGRCACPRQATDGRGRACQGRVVQLPDHGPALCSPDQVTDEMLAAWRKRHG